jgi:hypothetical protein
MNPKVLTRKEVYLSTLRHDLVDIVVVLSIRLHPSFFCRTPDKVEEPKSCDSSLDENPSPKPKAPVRIIPGNR